MITLNAELLGVGHPALQNGGQAELIRQDDKNAWVQPMPGQPIFVVPLAAVITAPEVVPMTEFPELPMATVSTLSEPGAA